MGVYRNLIRVEQVKVGEIGEKYAGIKAEGDYAERTDAMDLS